MLNLHLTKKVNIKTFLYNTNNVMAKIRITESELKQVIRESVESVLNESIDEAKYFQVDLKTIPGYDELAAQGKVGTDGTNSTVITAYKRKDLYRMLENSGFTKDQIVQGLNLGAAKIFNDSGEDLTTKNRGQRKINRARVYSGKHGGKDASEITANQIKTLTDQVNDLSTKNTDLSNQVTTLKGEIARLTKERDAARAQGRKLSADYQNLQNQLNSANQARTQNAAAQQQNTQQKAPAQQTTQPQQNQAVLATQNAMKGVQIPPMTSPLGVVNTNQRR